MKHFSDSKNVNPLIKFFMIVCLFLCSFLSSTFAQVDPSSALLLRSTRSQGDSEDLSRYRVKPNYSDKKKEKKTQIEHQMRKLPAKRYVEQPEDQEVPQSLNEEPPKQIHEELVSPGLIKKKVEEMVLGGSGEKIYQYKVMLHPQDLRRNLIELDLAPIYIYNSSASNYWYRSYNTAGPGLNVGVNIWLTPFFAIHSSYLTSLSTELKANTTGTKFIEADHKWFNAGFSFRSFFGLTRKSKSLNFGLDFSEYELSVPSDATARIGLKSSGLRLSLEGDVPETTSKSWIIGMELLPNISHAEIKSGIEVKTGTSNSSNAIGFWLGKKITFDRKNQIYWKWSHRVEKNLFKGQVNQVDPKSGDQPTGTAVTNSTTMFHLGFIWGN